MQPQTTVPGPVIEYTMPEHKSYLPSPALIKNLGCLVKLVFGFTVLLGLGYFALVALNPKAREWATKGGGPTPFKALNQILAIPAQAIGKTSDVVVANDKRVGQLDGLIAGEEGKAKGGKGPVVDPFASPASPTGKAGSARATAAAESTDSSPQSVSGAAILALAEKRSPPPASDTIHAPPAPPKVVIAPAPDSPDQMKLAGDIIIAHASPAGAPRAPAAFFYWVVKLNVGGVTVSKPARVFINNRLAYEGDEINRTLGVTFARLDPANKLLIFRDQTGATVTRSY